MSEATGSNARKWGVPFLVMGLLFTGCIGYIELSESEPVRPQRRAAPIEEGANSVRLTYLELGDEWPLTVPEGQLSCDGGAVTLEADGVTYGVNGTALTAGHPRIDPIWADEPGGTGLKRNIGELIERGLKLCE